MCYKEYAVCLLTDETGLPRERVEEIYDAIINAWNTIKIVIKKAYENIKHILREYENNLEASKEHAYSIVKSINPCGNVTIQRKYIAVHCRNNC